MRARDVMSDGVKSIAADATVLEAAELLVRNRVSAMPVVDADGVMIGIVSEADLIGYADRGTASATAAHDSANVPRVTDVMTSDIVTADENASLAEVAELMLKHAIKRVPIVRDGLVVGIVSRANLLQALVSRGDQAPAHTANDHLRHAVAAALAAKDWELAQRRDLVINSGVVHLWGVVPSDELHDAYSAAAAAVPGVVAVRSHMHVKPA